ncbi:TPA: hypothetical protein ACNYO0_000588 [Streptococcus pyogenes]
MNLENTKLRTKCPSCGKSIILTFHTRRCPKCFLDFKKIKKDDNIIDITPLKKEIEIIDKKINRLNDLYINDLIDLPKLKKDIEELNHLKDDYNKAIKLNYLDKKNEDSLGMLMDNIDIRKSSYDVQSRIVKQLIDRVEVTMDNIDIIFKF